MKNPTSVIKRRDAAADLADIVQALYALGEQVNFLCDPLRLEFVAYWTSSKAVLVTLT